MSRNYVLAMLAGLAVLTACGPTTFNRTRTNYEPYANGELRQEKDGVIVELKPGTSLPPSFYAHVARCDQYGRIAVDASGRPVMEQISLARPRQMWHEVAITNHTDHVIRMNGVVPRLFDPSGSQYEALTRDDLIAFLYRERPCSSNDQAGAIFRSIKVFDRNIEVVPGTTSTFWIPFLPASKAMTGVWKFSIYELPVRLDSSGRPIKTTQFHMRLVAKEITETLTQENPFAPAKIVSTRESSPVTKSAAEGVEKTQSPSAVTNKENSAPLAPAQLSIRDAQQQLAVLGYNPGPADGKAGGKTAAALKRFQSDNGLAMTGQLDAATAALLNQRSKPADPVTTPRGNTSEASPKEAPVTREKRSATDL